MSLHKVLIPCFKKLCLIIRISIAMVNRMMYLIFYGMWRGQTAYTITYEGHYVLIATMKLERMETGDGCSLVPVLCKVFFRRENELAPERY